MTFSKASHAVCFRTPGNTLALSDLLEKRPGSINYRSRMSETTCVLNGAIYHLYEIYHLVTSQKGWGIFIH